MTETEHKIYVAIAEIKRLLCPMIDNVDDTEQIRYSTETLGQQLQKVVGRRIIKETLKNGQKSPR